MTDPDVQLVLAGYHAFARGDIDAAVANLAPEVVWTEPDEFPNGGHYVGPAAVADYLRASRAMWSELHSEPNAHRRGQQIVVTHHVAGRLADGSPHEDTVYDVFTVHNGEVIEMVAYADLAEVPQE